MKTTPLLITVILLAAGAGLGLWLADRSDATGSDPSPRVGEKLLAPETLESAREIQLLGDQGQPAVRLLQADNEWTLPDYFGLPVDFNKLSSFTRSLLEADIERHVTSNPESLDRLELGRNSVRLLGEDDKAWELQTGAQGSSGGQFIRFEDESSAYLTPASLYIDTTSKNWAQKQPLTFQEADVARIELSLDGEEPLVLARTTPGSDFAGENFPEEWAVKNGEVTRLIRTLANARFTDAVAADHPDAVAARDASQTVALQLFDGKRFTLEIGRRPAPPKEEPSEASAVGDGPSEAEEAQVDPPKPGPVFIFYRSNAPGFIWSDAMERAALKFPDHIFDQIPNSREELVQVES